MLKRKHLRRRAMDRYNQNLIGVTLLLVCLVLFAAVKSAQAGEEEYPHVYTNQYGDTFEVPWGKKVALVPWWWKYEDICQIKDGAMNPEISTEPRTTNECERDTVLSPSFGVDCDE